MGQSINKFVKVIKELKKLGWKAWGVLLYQPFLFFLLALNYCRFDDNIKARKERRVWVY